MERYLNAVKAHAGGMDAQGAQPRWAIVTSVDPATYRVKVALQPEGLLTGWVPVLSPSLGAGWGILSLPPTGAQVMVLPVGGSHEQVVVLGAAYSEPEPPAQPPSGPTGGGSRVPAGEFAMVHRSGAVLRFNADGTVLLKGSTVAIAGDLTVSGAVVVKGEVTAMGGASAVHLSTHRHDGVQSGTAQTNAPVPGT